MENARLLEAILETTSHNSKHLLSIGWITRILATFLLSCATTWASSTLLRRRRGTGVVFSDYFNEAESYDVPPIAISSPVL
jgi:hypothetical protein